jgi:hypothetical protein
MQIKDDISPNGQSNSALSVNGATPAAKLANTDRPKVDRPVLKRRDQSDIQKIETEGARHEARSGDLITQTRDLRAGVEALLEHEAALTAHAIADAPYRLQELINEKIEAYGYDYADLKSHNQSIREIWGFDNAE